MSSTEQSNQDPVTSAGTQAIPSARNSGRQSGTATALKVVAWAILVGGCLFSFEAAAENKVGLALQILPFSVLVSLMSFALSAIVDRLHKIEINTRR